MSIVKPLMDGPLDIVGDVHGEIDALNSLVDHLGYNANGLHPEGRRLVFVGDLVDRGPNSPAVVRLVRDLVAAEKAQCVLGNHDLNILLDHRKHENRWFYGAEFLDESLDPTTRPTRSTKCSLMTITTMAMKAMLNELTNALIRPSLFQAFS